MTQPVLAVAIRVELDVLVARQRARQISSLCGFTHHEQVRISTVVSELARDIYNYADSGKIEFGVSGESAPQWLVIQIEDEGPGINKMDTISSGQKQSATGIGHGILSAQRLMDTFDMTTKKNKGKNILLRKRFPSGASVISSASVSSFSKQLGLLPDHVALAEVRHQNKELADALAALKVHQEELSHLTKELQATNDSMVALNADLDTQAKLLQQADLRKDEFLAILAHELRNPLSAAAMAASLLTRSGVSEERTEELGQLITRQVAHMSRLVEDLLDVSRVTRGVVTIDKIPIDMCSAVQSAMEQTESLFTKKSHTFLSTLPAQPYYVSGDLTRMIQASSNLLSNAARYTPDGGQITLDLSADGDMITLQITDNGIGIDPDLLPRLFDLYVQAERSTDGKHGGLGLGLTLVKSIVELHQGSVSAISDGKGLGSRFEVRLPRLHLTA